MRLAPGLESRPDRASGTGWDKVGGTAAALPAVRRPGSRNKAY